MSPQREGSRGGLAHVTPSPLNYSLTHAHDITSVTPRGWGVKYLVIPAYTPHLQIPDFLPNIPSRRRGSLLASWSESRIVSECQLVSSMGKEEQESIEQRVQGAGICSTASITHAEVMSNVWVAEPCDRCSVLCTFDHLTCTLCLFIWQHQGSRCTDSMALPCRPTLSHHFHQDLNAGNTLPTFFLLFLLLTSWLGCAICGRFAELNAGRLQPSCFLCSSMWTWWSLWFPSTSGYSMSSTFS